MIKIFIITLLITVLIVLLMYFTIIKGHQNINNSQSYNFANNYVKSNSKIIEIVGQVKDTYPHKKFGITTKLSGKEQEGKYVIYVFGEKSDIVVKIKVVYIDNIWETKEFKIINESDLESVAEEFTIE